MTGQLDNGLDGRGVRYAARIRAVQPRRHGFGARQWF